MALDFATLNPAVSAALYGAPVTNVPAVVQEDGTFVPAGCEFGQHSKLCRNRTVHDFRQHGPLPRVQQGPRCGELRRAGTCPR